MTDYGTVKESVQEPNHATICWVSSFKQQSHMNWTSQTHDDFRDSASQKLKTTCSSTLTQRIFDFNWTIFHRSIWCWVLERAHSTISCLTSSTKVSFLQCAVVWTSYVQVSLRSHGLWWHHCSHAEVGLVTQTISLDVRCLSRENIAVGEKINDQM